MIKIVIAFFICFIISGCEYFLQDIPVYRKYREKHPIKQKDIDKIAEELDGGQRVYCPDCDLLNKTWFCPKCGKYCEEVREK